jgi:hypothetical protein
MATKTNPIFTQIGDEVIELQGAELEAFLATRKEMQNQYEAEKEDLKAKAAQRQVIADRLGLTADELKLLLG